MRSDREKLCPVCVRMISVELNLLPAVVMVTGPASTEHEGALGLRLFAHMADLYCIQPHTTTALNDSMRICMLLLGV